MRTNRNTKDSIFTHLFSDPIYQLQLYKELNPDSEDVTIDDLQDVTLENIFTIQQMNDLGFIVKDKILFLVEAQSTWTENILLRMLFYYFETWKRIIIDQDASLFSSKRIPLVSPVFYVIYTGNQKVPDTISFKEIYWEYKINIDAEAFIIHNTNNQKNISSQYILFCSVFDQQRRIYKYSKKAIEETLRICKNEGILKSYIESKESEVIDIMSYFMDVQKATELELRDLRNDLREEVKEEVRETTLAELVKDGILSIEEFVKRTNLSKEQIYKMYPELK